MQSTTDTVRALMTAGGRLGSFERADAVAVGTLFAIPLVTLLIAAVAGYPLLTGDDLVQSYPLSVLSAQIISHGHLPVYNPYLWSGSPLLAGANAHVLLPTTLLFTFLPSLAAWIIGEALTLGLAATGCYLLLRMSGCRTLAAALGGATFGLGGFVSSQVVHIDFVSAAASLVWCLVAIDGIVRDEPRRRALWAAVLAVGFGYMWLSASPDIVIDAVVATVAYGGHLLMNAPGRRLACLGWGTAGTVTGLLLGAAQWLPTADFLAVSERGHASYVFASSGSLSPAELLVSVVPHVLGGGPIGLETYTGPYNLAEIDAYCGILSLVAVVSLAARWRSANAGRWRVWYLVGGLGLLLALGAHTPLEHVLIHLPVVGDQRLPSRALILFSLASAMLLGFWVEEQLSSEPGDTSRAALAAGLVGPLAVIGLVAATAISAKPYGGLLDAVPGLGWSLRAVWPYLAVAAVLALGAGVVVVRGTSWSRRRLARAIAVLAIADLLVFTADQSSLAPVSISAIAAENPLQAQLAARLAGGGRFVVVDPSRSGGKSLDRVGGSDFGVMSGLRSAQGYGSLTWGPYAQATGTHSQDDLDPASLAGGAFDSLDVRVLLTVPSELSVPLRRAGTTTLGPAEPPGLGAPPIAGDGPVASPIDLYPGRRADRWFGRSLVVRTVTLEMSGRQPGAGAWAALGRSVRLFLGATRPQPAIGRGSVSVRSHSVAVTFPAAQGSVGLSVVNRVGARVHVAAVVVQTRSGASFGLDGPLASDLTAPHWDAAGTIGPFAVFENRRASGQFSSPQPAGAGVRPVRVRVVSSSAWTPTESVGVTASRPVTVVRSVADIPGWHATETHDGVTRVVPLERVGLVQSFDVPAGFTLVTFSYSPPGLRPGLVASAFGVLGLLVLGGLGLARARRRGVTADEELSALAAAPATDHVPLDGAAVGAVPPAPRVPLDGGPGRIRTFEG